MKFSRSSVLVYKCEARDILVVVLNPRGEDEVPTTAEAIGERLKQISFSSTLSTELHAVALARAKARSARFALGRVDRRLARLNLHMIDSGAYLASLDPASRLNTDSAFIELLHREGRKRADAWLARNATSLGARSTFRFDRVFART